MTHHHKSDLFPCIEVPCNDSSHSSPSFSDPLSVTALQGLLFGKYVFVPASAIHAYAPAQTIRSLRRLPPRPAEIDEPNPSDNVCKIYPKLLSLTSLAGFHFVVTACKPFVARHQMVSRILWSSYRHLFNIKPHLSTHCPRQAPVSIHRQTAR